MDNHLSAVLVGNTLAQMIAALELSKKGEKVAIVNSSKNWGGHFNPIIFDGSEFDAGMVLYEFTSYYDESENNLLSYNPLVRNDAGKFCSIIKKYVNQYIDNHEIESPKMYVAGQYHEDILITNNLSGISSLPNIRKIKEELKIICASEFSDQELHASNKIKSNKFTYTDFETVSSCNHGETFHKTLIEPYSKKLVNSSTKNILALYHRVPWLPLFYPETLLSYIEGSPQKLPKTIFSYPNNTCSSMLGKKILEDICNNRNITIFTDNLESIKESPDKSLHIHLSNGIKITTNNLGWGLSNDRFLEATGKTELAKQYEKCSIALLFVKVPKKDIITEFTVLNIIDENILTYRISNQTYCRGSVSETESLVLEVNPDYAKSKRGDLNNDELVNLMLNELVKLDIISTIEKVSFSKLIQLKNALMLPTRNNRDNFLEELGYINKNYPNVNLFGPASGFFSSSLNDQIVQGLKFSDQWKIFQ